MRLSKYALGLLAATLPFMAQPAAAQSQDTRQTPPQLVVAISVDQFSADLFSEYRSTFTGGLKRLSSGVVFPRAYQSHAGTETCPGHSTILTGARPGRTGIIANSWIDQSVERPDKTIYCVEDERAPGSSSSNYVASLLHLRTPTLGDRMKQADPEMRVVSVAGKDRAALLLGGGSADQLWWIGSTGFATLQGRSTPAEVDQANAAFAAALATPRGATPMLTQCEARDLAVDVGQGKQVGQGRFEREAGDFLGLRATPEYDAMVLNLAGALMDELDLGRRGHTDLLALGLSATDYIGHTFGNGGVESCLQVAALDRALGVFFDRLDARGIDYVVMLTADHGGHDLPERHRQNAMPDEVRIDPALYPAALSAMLEAETGLSGPLVLGPEPVGDLYLGKALSPADRADVEKRLVERLRANPQILSVFTRSELAETPLATARPDDWTLIERVRAGFDAERAGDLFVVAQPWVTQEKDASKRYIAMHGQPFDNDRRVPLMFWRQGLRGFEQPLAVETVDIAPTLAALVGLSVEAGEMDGRCLDLLAGPASSCEVPNAIVEQGFDALSVDGRPPARRGSEILPRPRPTLWSGGAERGSMSVIWLAADRQGLRDTEPGMMSNKAGPLAGVRIVEFDAIGPVPLAAMLLADLGCEIVRIARAPNSGQTWGETGGAVLNRNRKHVHLDLKSPEDRDRALALIEKADGLLEGFRPGVMERLGLGPEACFERNPRLVFARMTGWGQTGPLALRAGHDINYIAITGALHAMGSADRPPAPPLNLVGDYGGGAMFAIVGLLSAIISAGKTGVGQVVDVAMTDGTAALTSMFHAFSAIGMWSDARGANLLDGSKPFYRCYACADGGHVAVGALEPQFFARLLEGLGMGQDRFVQYDPAGWAEMEAVFAETFLTRTRDEWDEVFRDTDACVSPVLSFSEAADHPHNRARATLVDQSGVTQPAPAPRFSETVIGIDEGRRGLVSMEEALSLWGD